MAKDNRNIDDARMLSDEELEAVTGGANAFYSIGETQTGRHGEYKVFTYYDENRKATGHLACPIDKIDAMIERLNGRGMKLI